MLKRVTAALYVEDAGAHVQLAVIATNNKGVEDARFEYDGDVLPRGTLDSHPACRFDVKAGSHQLRVIVAFHPDARDTAHYDLLQVNDGGALQPVGASVTKAASAPIIGFGIDGVAVPAVAGVAPAAVPAGRQELRTAATSKTAAPQETPRPTPTRPARATRGASTSQSSAARTETTSPAMPTKRPAAKRPAGTKAKGRPRAAGRESPSRKRR